jgi:hypothetical protein
MGKKLGNCNASRPRHRSITRPASPRGQPVWGPINAQFTRSGYSCSRSICPPTIRNARMHSKAFALVIVVGLGVCAGSANAAPLAPAPVSPEPSNIVQVAQGCGLGFHRNYRGYCMRNYRPYAYHRHYYRSRPYGFYRAYPYYGGGYEPWNRPSPSDHVANWLNAQEARRGWGY